MVDQIQVRLGHDVPTGMAVREASINELIPLSSHVFGMKAASKSNIITLARPSSTGWGATHSEHLLNIQTDTGRLHVFTYAIADPNYVSQTGYAVAVRTNIRNASTQAVLKSYIVPLEYANVAGSYPSGWSPDDFAPKTIPQIIDNLPIGVDLSITMDMAQLIYYPAQTSTRVKWRTVFAYPI